MITMTGAAGQLGRLVAQDVVARVGAAGVTLASRDPAKLADFAAKGVRTVRADFDDAASVETALAGAKTALLISADGPNDARIRQHRVAIDAARRAGVGRVVYTSFTNPSPASLFPFAAIHADSEAYLKASGLAFTMLRNNQYAENLANGLANAVKSGTLAIPGATGKVAYITRADIAAAAAAVLTGEGHAGKTYELTGPEAVDAFQVGAALAKALGRRVDVVDAEPAAFGKVLASFGLPPFLVEALLGIYAAAAAGEMAAVSPDAAKLTGRAIEPMSAFVARFAAQAQAA